MPQNAKTQEKQIKTVYRNFRVLVQYNASNKIKE